MCGVGRVSPGHLSLSVGADVPLLLSFVNCPGVMCGDALTLVHLHL